jgi:uracil-DNA glycosylase
MSGRLKIIHDNVIACTRCARLRRYCEEIARVKRRAYREESYWGKPVPGFGNPTARLLIIGLAPAAHGGNRTGRVFTGDRSGDFLFASLYRAGFANRPMSRNRHDGLRVNDTYITAAVHCAPPDNKPSQGEFDRCREFLVREIRSLKGIRVVVALGKMAFDEYLKTLKVMGRMTDHRGIRFQHAARYVLGKDLPVLMASYHPSQQNTQTGRLTPAMMDEIFSAVHRELSSLPAQGFPLRKTPTP